VSEPLLIEVVRDGTVESTHHVDVAVVDARGELLASAGDPQRAAAFRSSAKPLQAGVARALGWSPADPTQLAIACASHGGEPEHIAAVSSVLASAGLDAEALRCPSALPLHPGAATEPQPIQHNCSGKHAGMLAACVAAGLPTQTYLERDHPLQVAIADRMGSLLGAAPVSVLTDGCGAPTVVAPLARLARAFASIRIDGEEASAMRAYPRLVGGTGRFDTDVMGLVPGLCVKGGAEALFCATDGRTTLALKVRDGGARAVGPAAALVLGELGIADAEHVQTIVPPVTGGARPVGTLRARGSLR